MRKKVKKKNDCGRVRTVDRSAPVREARRERADFARLKCTLGLVLDVLDPLGRLRRPCDASAPGGDAERALLLKEQMKLLRGIYINNDIYYIYIHIIYIFIIRDKDN